MLLDLWSTPKAPLHERPITPAYPSEAPERGRDAYWSWREADRVPAPIRLPKNTANHLSIPRHPMPARQERDGAAPLWPCDGSRRRSGPSSTELFIILVSNGSRADGEAAPEVGDGVANMQMFSAPFGSQRVPVGRFRSDICREGH